MTAPRLSNCEPAVMQVRAQYGFTYLWTLLLVALMGLGLVLVSEIYATTLQREREQELLFIGREFRDAIGRYYESGVGGGQHQYPARLDDLLKDPRVQGTQRYLRRIYTDPMTGRAEWGLDLVQGRLVGIHSLSEEAPIKQENFEPSEAEFTGKAKYSDWKFTYPAGLLMSAQKAGTVQSVPQK